MPECRLVGNSGEKGKNWQRIVSYLAEHASYGATSPGTPTTPIGLPWMAAYPSILILLW